VSSTGTRCGNEHRTDDDCDDKGSNYSAHLKPAWMIDRSTAAAAGSSCTFQSR
jgi:hypothetical protein